MAKVTQKTNSRLKKVVSKNGKIGCAGRNHKTGKLTGKSNRKKRGKSAISSGDARRLKSLLK